MSKMSPNLRKKLYALSPCSGPSLPLPVLRPFPRGSPLSLNTARQSLAVFTLCLLPSPAYSLTLLERSRMPLRRCYARTSLLIACRSVQRVSRISLGNVISLYINALNEVQVIRPRSGLPHELLYVRLCVLQRFDTPTPQLTREGPARAACSSPLRQECAYMNSISVHSFLNPVCMMSEALHLNYIHQFSSFHMNRYRYDVWKDSGLSRGCNAAKGV